MPIFVCLAGIRPFPVQQHSLKMKCLLKCAIHEKTLIGVGKIQLCEYTFGAQVSSEKAVENV